MAETRKRNENIDFLRVVCFHLFNDYSGSPRVLKMILKGLLEKGYRVDLISSEDGVLDELRGHKKFYKYNYKYKFSHNSLITTLRYVVVQIYTFFLALRFLFSKNVVFYINTILPVGPAIAGKLMGKKVIYHYHENAAIKGLLYSILAWIMQKLADTIICVSAYQASYLKRKNGVVVVPNAVSKEFAERLNLDVDAAFECKTVLMLSSLKGYKGTSEFVELAAKLPVIKFVLVVSDNQENIDKYLCDNINYGTLNNLEVHSRQDDVVPFYNTASLVLNLSNKDKVIETFGMTALEAMSAGLPVIVPTVGGIAEMVEEGVNGYKIDVQNVDKIAEYIMLILSDKSLYKKLSNNALDFSRKYDAGTMINKIISHITQTNC